MIAGADSKSYEGSRTPDNQPNILLIMADQFAAHALGAPDGGQHSHFSTPYLDSLAERSAVFERAYTSFPLCVPARSSMMTGLYPHQIGVEGNSHRGNAVEPGRDPQSLGQWFSSKGYDCAYAGKWHARQPSAGTDDGFTPIHPFGDVGLVHACEEWLAAREPNGAPFLLVASFDDPHSICEYARQQPLPYGAAPSSSLRSAPPLPANFRSGPYAPQAPFEERKRAAGMYGTSDYTPDDWRAYRHTYSQLVFRVDAYIGALLQALDASGAADNTVIVFTSDHGDGDAAHGWNQKTALYEECIRVPFLVSGPGIRPGRRGLPVAAALDLFPTLCSLTGVPHPPGLEGRNVFFQDSTSEGMKPVVVETAFNYGQPPNTTGRSLLCGRYKYTVYSWGKWREQLVDLAADPGELRNLAVEDRFDRELEQLRSALLRWCLETNDAGFLKYLTLPANAPPDLQRKIFAVPY